LPIATPKEQTPPDVLTIDVEDWYHILEVEGTPGEAQWGAMASRVEANFRRLLEMLAAHQVRATCFFLGWIAEKFPALVREAKAAGHEIASHGYSHVLIYSQTEKEFYEDVRRAKGIIEDLAGAEVLGYRAPGFSIVASTPWALDRLAAAGYRYDASVFPGSRGHGGMPGAEMGPHRVRTAGGEIVEVPVTLARVLGRRVCFFGGGYFRLFPYGVVRRMARRVKKEGRPVVWYIHPRDIDAEQPRLAMSGLRRFKSYVNLRGAAGKLERLLADGRFVTCGELVKNL
jgi:polysaccharide deacetylase family protein (PEP-CTERM system associated)